MDSDFLLALLLLKVKKKKQRHANQKNVLKESETPQ